MTSIILTYPRTTSIDEEATIIENEFTMCLLGNTVIVKATGEKMRYRIAEAFSNRAHERQEEGRPDVAGRLRWTASQIKIGRPPTKRVMGKLRADITIIEQRLVDGISEAVYPVER